MSVARRIEGLYRLNGVDVKVHKNIFASNNNERFYWLVRMPGLQMITKMPFHYLPRYGWPLLVKGSASKYRKYRRQWLRQRLWRHMWGEWPRRWKMEIGL